MRPWVQKLLLGSLATFVSAGIIVLPFLIFIKPNNQFVFGNFQSYISEDVKTELQSDYKINWQYYGSNAEIPTFIQNKTLDAAVATDNMVAQLAINDEIQPIPWSEFNLTKSDGTKINSYKDLQGFVTDSIWKLGEEMAIATNLKDPDNHDQVGNLLAYCVPYFLQTFTFAYRGEKIPTSSLSENASYKEIFEYISKNNYFTSKSGAVMMIDDARSIYDVSRIVSGASSINPEYGVLTSNQNSSEVVGIDEIVNTYNNIFNYYSVDSNVMTFNTDSSIVLNKVALNESYGAFMYNGDAIYAAMGGDNPEDTPNLPNFETTTDFHVILPEANFFAMDGIVLNKSMKEEKKSQAIEIIKKLCLSGLDNGEDISATNSDGEYEYMSTNNFSYINYTPCYQALYEYATDKSSDGYFPSLYDSTSLIETLVKLVSINADNISKNSVELPLNETTISNMNLAYLDFKNKI